MLEKVKKFLKEEKAQGAIEYILLAGGIIVAAIVVFAVYKRMAASTATSVETQAGKTVNCSQYTTNSSCVAAGCRWDSTYNACFPP